MRAINADEVRELAAKRPPVTDVGLRTLVGALSAVPAPRVVERTGSAATSDGERLVVEVESGVRLRGWLRRAATATGPAMLLVDEKAATLRGATVDGLVASGYTVLALDIRGTGDLGPTQGASGYSGAYQFAARAWLLGTSVPAWQARDVVSGVALLRTLAPDAAAVHVRAAGQTGPAALFAAQVARPGQLVLEDTLVSYLDSSRLRTSTTARPSRSCPACSASRTCRNSWLASPRCACASCGRPPWRRGHAASRCSGERPARRARPANVTVEP